MTILYVTTTGTKSPIIIDSLGSSEWTHPVVNKPLNGPQGEYSNSDLEIAYPELLNGVKNGDFILTTKDSIVINEKTENVLEGQSLFGSNYFYAESESTTTTTSATPTTKLTLTTSDLPVGLYRILFYFEMSNNSTNGVVVGRVEYDSSFLGGSQVLISESSFEPDDTAINGLATLNSTNDEWTVVSGFKSNILLEGISNFYVKFLDAEAGVSAIRRARLELMRIK